MAKGKKTGGRKKGTPNRITGATRDILKDVVERELQGLEERLEQLTAKERVEVLTKLLPYVTPRCKPEPPKYLPGVFTDFSHVCEYPDGLEEV
jgi:hypothetical protein